MAPAWVGAAPAGRGTGRLAVLLGLLVAAVALTVTGAAQLRALWRRLPTSQIAQLDPEPTRRALAAAHASQGGAAREGRFLAVIGQRFIEALHEPHRLAEILQDAQVYAERLPRSQLGRLQLAALTMLRLERGNVPTDRWWPTLQPYLTGLQEASFAHYIAEFSASEAAIYQRLGIDAGTARCFPLESVGAVHGPLLQYLIDRLQRLAAQRQEAGDSAAETTCRRIAGRVLRDWFITPGPSALRLLAAELLADHLDAVDNPAVRSEHSALAAKLRRWRQTYRRNAAALPTPPPPLRITEEASARGPAARLTARLALSAWSAAALVGVSLVALLAGGLSIRLARGGKLGIREACLAAGPATLTVLIAWAVTVWAPQAVWDDFQRVAAPEPRWPRLPLVAALGGLVVAGAAGVVPVARCRDKREGLGRGGATLLAAWLLLGAVLVGLSFATETARRGYEAALARPLDQQLAAVADPGADGLLDAVRAWNP